MPPRRVHPAQPQAHPAEPRPRALRLRWARGVAGRGAARSAQRSCGQVVDGGARVSAEGQSGGGTFSLYGNIFYLT